MLRWIAKKFIGWLSQDRPTEGLPLCDFERIRYELRPCDVLLIEGRSHISDVIKSITQSSWSHAALYLGRLHDIEDPKTRNMVQVRCRFEPDTQLILESVLGKGTIVNSLSFYEKDHIRICRPKGLSRKDAQEVLHYAIKKIGTHYDSKQIFDLLRFLFPYAVLPRKWRSTLFETGAGEDIRTVCSTVIAEAFGSVDFPILPLVKQHVKTGIELIKRNPKLYTPKDFDYSPYFEIIKYPYVEFADYALYRKLPWNRDGLISHDKEGVLPIKQLTDFEMDSTEPLLATTEKKTFESRVKKLFKRPKMLAPKEAAKKTPVMAPAGEAVSSKDPHADGDNQKNEKALEKDHNTHPKDQNN